MITVYYLRLFEFFVIRNTFVDRVAAEKVKSHINITDTSKMHLCKDGIKTVMHISLWINRVQKYVQYTRNSTSWSSNNERN